MSILYLLVFLAQVDIIKTANDLENKSDRWMFIATLIILLLAGVMAFRWLVKSLETLTIRHEQSSARSEERIGKICDDQHTTMKELAVTIDRNTCALEEGSAERSKTRDVLQLVLAKL